MPVEMEIWGAGGAEGGDGENPGGGASGGNGGYIKIQMDVVEGETYDLNIGSTGNPGDGWSGGGNGGAGGSGWYNGGDGGNSGSSGGGGGGGGGASVIKAPDGTAIAIGEGGGGGGGSYDSANYTQGGGGGGGARGGTGAARGGNDGNGSGGGGDGGTGGTDSSSYEAGSGGSQSYGGSAALLSSNTGGGNSGNGSATITWDDVPSAPSNAGASADNEDDVTVTWTDNSSVEDEFEVYRDTSSGVDRSSGTLAGTVGANTTTFTDTGLNNATTYYYVVYAVNGDTYSDPSNEASATTGYESPTLDSLDTSVENEVTVNWTKNDPYSDGSFKVYRSTDGTKGTAVATGLSASTTSWTDTGVDDGTEYHYTVARVDPSGVESDSGQKAATTILPAATEFGVTDSGIGTLTYGWVDNADSEVGYRIHYSRDDGATWSTTPDLAADSTSHQLTGLKHGEKYRAILEVFTADASSYSGGDAADLQ